MKGYKSKGSTGKDGGHARPVKHMSGTENMRANMKTHHAPVKGKGKSK